MDTYLFSLFGSRISLTVIAMVFSMGIILSNLLLIGTILRKKELRQNSKYVLVVVLALTDLYLGVVIYPLQVHIQLTQSIGSCLTLRTLQGSAFIKIAMSGLAIVSINLDYIFKKTIGSYLSRYGLLGVKCLSCVFTVGPLVVFIPMFIGGRESPHYCQLNLLPSYYKATLFLSYWVPSACVLLTTMGVILIYQRSTRHILYQDQTSISPPNAQTPIDMVLVAILTLLLPFPEFIYITSRAFGDTFYLNQITVLAFEYVAHSRAFLVPGMWFVNKKLLVSLLGRGRGELSSPPSNCEPPALPDTSNPSLQSADSNISRL